jgi:hypothetical protein
MPQGQTFVGKTASVFRGMLLSWFHACHITQTDSSRKCRVAQIFREMAVLLNARSCGEYWVTHYNIFGSPCHTVGTQACICIDTAAAVTSILHVSLLSTDISSKVNSPVSEVQLELSKNYHQRRNTMSAAVGENE